MAALALLVALPARAAEVVSVNTVGYTKVPLNHAYTMLGMQFQTVGAANGSLTIGQIVPDKFVNGIDWTDDNWPFGATMMLWNGSSYVGGQFYWTGEVPADTQEELKEELELDEDVVYNNIWVNGDYEPVDPGLSIGEGFWIFDATANGTGKVCMNGEVSTNSVTLRMNSGYTMIANPYPMALNLNEMTITGLTSIDWTDDNWPFGTTLMIWNGSSYVGGQFYWTGEVPADTQEELKEELELDEEVVYNNIWVNGDYEPVSVSVPVGGGFWIYDVKANPQTSSITFSAPKN